MKSLKYTTVIVVISMMFKSCSFYYEISSKENSYYDYNYYFLDKQSIILDSIYCGKELLKSSINFGSDLLYMDEARTTKKYAEIEKIFEFFIGFGNFDIVPEVVLHSFYLSNERGDTIPYLTGYGHGDSAVFIKSLPFVFNEEEWTKRMLPLHFYPDSCMVKGLLIFARNTQGFYREREFKKTFVTYDIEINGKRYADRILYRRKLEFDFGY